MTVSDQTRRNRYEANGTDTVFMYTFRIERESDLSVAVYNASGSLQDPTPAHTISGVGVNAGGMVTFTAAPTNEFIIVLSSALPMNQERNIRNQSTLYLQELESGVDKATQLIQDVDVKVDRAISIHPSANYNTVIPADLSEAEVITIDPTDGINVGVRVPNGHIQNTHLGLGVVETDNIDDLAVTHAKLGHNAVLPVNINNNAVIGSKIENGVVTNPKLSANAVHTNNILNDAVTGAKIGNNAIGEEHIRTNAVTRNEIAPTTITSDEISNDAIIRAKIENSAIDNSKLANNAVQSDNIQAGAVTSNKLNGNVITGQTAVTTVADTDQFLLSTSDGLRRVTRDNLLPATISHLPVNDITANVTITNDNVGDYIGHVNVINQVGDITITLAYGTMETVGDILYFANDRALAGPRVIFTVTDAPGENIAGANQYVLEPTESVGIGLHGADGFRTYEIVFSSIYVRPELHPTIVSDDIADNDLVPIYQVDSNHRRSVMTIANLEEKIGGGAGTAGDSFLSTLTFVDVASADVTSGVFEITAINKATYLGHIVRLIDGVTSITFANADVGDAFYFSPFITTDRVVINVGGTANVHIDDNNIAGEFQGPAGHILGLLCDSTASSTLRFKSLFDGSGPSPSPLEVRTLGTTDVPANRVVDSDHGRILMVTPTATANTLYFSDLTPGIFLNIVNQSSDTTLNLARATGYTNDDVLLEADAIPANTTVRIVVSRTGTTPEIRSYGGGGTTGGGSSTPVYETRTLTGTVSDAANQITDTDNNKILLVSGVTTSADDMRFTATTPNFRVTVINVTSSVTIRVSSATGSIRSFNHDVNPRKNVTFTLLNITSESMPRVVIDEGFSKDSLSTSPSATTESSIIAGILPISSTHATQIGNVPVTSLRGPVALGESVSNTTYQNSSQTPNSVQIALTTFATRTPVHTVSLRLHCRFVQQGGHTAAGLNLILANTPNFPISTDSQMNLFTFSKTTFGDTYSDGFSVYSISMLLNIEITENSGIIIVDGVFGALEFNQPMTANESGEVRVIRQIETPWGFNPVDTLWLTNHNTEANQAGFIADYRISNVAW